MHCSQNNEYVYWYLPYFPNHVLEYSKNLLRFNILPLPGEYPVCIYLGVLACW